MTIPSKEEQLQNMAEYLNAIHRLKQQSSQGMLDKEFKKLYEKTIDSLTAPPRNVRQQSQRKKYVALILSITLAITLIANYKVIYTCIACNLQDYIYPGLRILRTFFIPLISWFSSLTGK